MYKDKLLSVIPLFLILAGIFSVALFVNYTTEQTKQRQLESQTYARFNSCSLSFPPGTRDAKDIDFCWKQAMKDTGKHVKRYGNTDL